MIRVPADAPARIYDRLPPVAISRLLDRLLAAARATGVPKRVVLERAVIPPLIPLAEVLQWPDQALQRLVLKAYLKDLGDQNRGGGEFPEDADDPQQPSTGEPS
jgi:hypothetical protein